MEKNKEESREEFYKRIKKYTDVQDIFLVKKVHEFGDVYSFIFKPTHRVNFTPGQYAHFVIHDLPESSGKPVRYLSIASAPSDEHLQFTTHVRNGSLHKQKLGSLSPGDRETIYKVKGEFVLPNDTNKQVILIAGGIGITPYRSMLREEVHKKSDRDISLVHVSDGDFLFESELSNLPFSQKRVRRDDLQNCLERIVKEKPHGEFFVSGPPGFVDGTKTDLQNLMVKEENIKQDWFDGYDDF